MSTMSGDRSMASSFITMFVVVTAVLLAALMLLGGGLGEAQRVQMQAVRQSSAPAIEWLRPDQVFVPRGLLVNAHAVKHDGDTEKIYQMLLGGKCAAVAKFCGGSEIEKLYACTDPVTGLVGIILQFGDEITTGYFSHNSNNLGNRVSREKWEVCK